MIFSLGIFIYLLFAPVFVLYKREGGEKEKKKERREKREKGERRAMNEEGAWRARLGSLLNDEALQDVVLGEATGFHVVGGAEVFFGLGLVSIGARHVHNAGSLLQAREINGIPHHNPRDLIKGWRRGVRKWWL